MLKLPFRSECVFLHSHSIGGHESDMRETLKMSDLWFRLRFGSKDQWQGQKFGGVLQASGTRVIIKHLLPGWINVPYG